MHLPAAQLLCELCFVCIRPTLTNAFSVEHFCPLNTGFNRALNKLILDSNKIQDEGTAALSEALKSNNTLETLELHNNQIGVAGAQSLASMLQVNRALKSVDLRANRIPEEGKQQLRDAASGKGITLQL